MYSYTAVYYISRVVNLYIIKYTKIQNKNKV